MQNNKMNKFQKESNLTELISHDISERIKKGFIKPGEKLPSETEYAKNFGVSRNSIREAFNLLESSGLVIKRQGVGTFVTENRPLIKGGLERLHSIMQFITDNNCKAESKLLDYKMMKVEPNIAEKLGIESGSEVHMLESIKIADGYPVALCLDIIPKYLLGSDIDPEYLSESIFDGLKQNHHLNIQSAECSIFPMTADLTLALKLQITQNKPLVFLDQIHYDDLNRKVLYSKSYFPCDRFSFKLVRYR
jgi:GntR family transcriptional regulator